MRDNSRFTLALVCKLAVALLGTTGCTTKMAITQTPDFYTSDLKTIAVVPFRNQTGVRDAGKNISDRLAAALAANGTYQVFNRNDLKAIMDERDLQLAFGDDTEAAVAKFRRLGNVQAILLGSVNTYSGTVQRQQKRDPVYGFNPQTGALYVSGYKKYVWTRHEANVAVTVSLIKVSTGKMIYSTSTPAAGSAWAEGSPPKYDAYACLNAATNQAVGQLVQTFAVIRKEIKVNPGKALRTASELYDNKWTYKDQFEKADEKMYVVVSLPRSCDRNRFKITVVRKHQREDLAAQDVVWDKEYNGYGYVFSPKEIAANGGGPGPYEVKFYSGPEPIMRRDFWIR